MEILMIIVILFASYTFILVFQTLLQFFSTGGQKKLPPGPKPLPLIGNLHLLGRGNPHEALTKLARIHGPLMSLRLGSVNTVVISSAEMARQVLQKQDMAFSTRSIPDAVHAHDHHKYSLVWIPVASRWRTLRKLLNANMFSTTRLDACRHLRVRKVRQLVDYFRKCRETGTPVDVGRAAFRTTLNVLSNTVFSKDFADPLSDSAKELKEIVEDMAVEAGKPNIVDFFPILRRFDPQGIRTKMSVLFGEMIELFGGLIDERLEKRKSSLMRGSATDDDDVIDVLLAKSKNSPAEEIDRTQIERICMDLFLAGTDTTSSTLVWAMSETLRNPKVMRKAKSELEQVIGKSKILDETTDISRLPYLQSIIKETLRIHPAVPLIPRRVVKDVQVFGYTIPKDSQVLINCWAIGRDPTTWKDPLEFKPERFLMESDRLDVRGRDFELIPFGAGRRICPGLPLAERMLPEMLGSLLNSFDDWELDGGGIKKLEELDMQEKFGITLQKAEPLRVVPKINKLA